MITPQDLIRIYPWLDHMLAETLIKHHENGTLVKHMESWPEPKWEPMQTKILEKGITVLPPEEKSALQITTDGQRSDL